MNLSLLPALALLPLSAFAAPEADPSQRMIVNGEEEAGYPTAVSLMFEIGQFRQSFCSGSLITPRMVLTAGHCTEEFARQFGANASQIVEFASAAIGRRIDGPNLRAIPFQDIRNHPRYGTSGFGQPQYDIGVVVLAEEVTDIEPIWFSTDLSDAVGNDVLSVGWGVTSTQAQNSAGTKRSAVLTIHNTDEQFLYSRSDLNEGGTNICSGDSGGPQYHIADDGTITQWGVHSFGFNPTGGRDFCGPGGISGSTRTDLDLDWLFGEIEAVHGTSDRCDIYGYYDPPTGPRKCHTDCPEPDPICAADLNEDGFVDQEEFDRVDRDGDGVLSERELERAGRGCNQGGAPTSAALALLALLGLRRRRA